MSSETEKIMNIVIDTKSLLDDFMKHLIDVERRLQKIENQIS